VKWAALAVALAAIIPLAAWLRRNPREVPKIWVVMGFLPFVVQDAHLYMAAISWAGWPGFVKGAEVSVIDLLALALYLSLPRNGFTLPFRLSMALYFLAVLLSAFQTPVPIATLFYAWQLARMFLVYAVVAKACADERVVPALLTGMTIGLCLQACVSLWERFGLGILQAGGTLGHQNYVGLVSHFVTFPAIALLLAGERGWQPIAGPLMGLISAVLTVSRATIGLLGIGFLGLFSLSILRQPTSRKVLLLAASVAVASIAAPFVLSSFAERFAAQQPEGNYDERAAFEKAAGMIISDHPMGVGANYYVVSANTGGYNTRAGVAMVIGSDSANVHNIYYLVTAETGYLGLVTFLLMLLQPLVVAFRYGWRCRDRRGDLLLGFGMSLFIVYVHSYFEWIFITFSAQYMFALVAGSVAGIAMQLGYRRHSQAANQVAPVSPNAIAPIARTRSN
jgi:O-antigen ligase